MDRIIKIWNSIPYNNTFLDVRQYNDNSIDFKYDGKWSSKYNPAELDIQFLNLLLKITPDIKFNR